MDTPLSRRSLLTTAGLTAAGVVTGGLALTALAGCTGTNVARPTASPIGEVTEQLEQVMTTIANGSDKFGVFVQDVRSGATWGYNGDYSSQNASMAKVMIALMALKKSGGMLSPENDALATNMITQSDNDAADALWAYAGGADAYQKLAETLQMTHTHRDQGRPDWSWTWTTPSDQVLLLRLLTEGGTDAITGEQAAYVYGLMGKVENDQTWGVGQPKSAEVQVHLKNGWVQFKSTDNLWAVNSMGTVDGDGRGYRLAVMTREPDFDTGRDVTSEVGKWVFSILGSGTL